MRCPWPVAALSALLAPTALADERGDWVEAWRSTLDLHIRDVEFSGERLVAAGHGQPAGELRSDCTRSGLLVFSGRTGELLERHAAEPAEGDLLRQPFQRRLAVDGRSSVALAGADAVLLWTAALGEEPRRLPCDDPPDRVALSPDGRYLASGGFGDRAWLWDLSSDGPPRPLPGHGAGVLELVFSPDGRRLASISPAAPLRVWSTATGELERAIPGEGNLVPTRAVFDADGGRLITIGLHGELTSYAVDTGAALGKVELRRLVMSSARSPDGSLLALGGGDDVTVVRLDTCAVVATLPSGATTVRLAFGADGRWLAVHGDGLVVWRRGPAPAGEPPAARSPAVAPAALTYPREFQRLCLTPDGDLFAAEFAGPVDRLRLLAGQLERVQRLEGAPTAWLGHFDGHLVRLVADPSDGAASEVLIHRLTDGAVAARISTGGAGRPEHVVQRDRWLGVQFRAPREAVLVFDLKQKKLVRALAADSTGLAVHPRGRHLALSLLSVADLRPRIEVVALERGRKEQEVPGVIALSGMAYRSDGAALQGLELDVATEVAVFRVRDARDLSELWSLPLGADATAVAYDPLDRWLAVEQGGAIHLLDLRRRTTQALLPCASVGAVAFSPDGARIAVSIHAAKGDDGVTSVRALPE